MRLYQTVEQTIHSASCRTSPLLFWLPTKFLVTNKRISVEKKNAFLGFIPYGHNTEDIIYRNISSVQSSSKLHPIRFLIGLWLFTSSFRLLTSPDFFMLGIIELILGLLLLVHCYKAKLKIITNSGKNTETEVSFIEINKVKKIAREVNNQIINY
ncbi:hypothetical protein [Priestia flexa]|uniref:hypothetical protein n=1 Tax=Priestia flexa TaxID=86664 RepID=UPI00077C2048|nr:hypothetical protein [Priestia flexa]MED4587683.1 hypothetical protein [Priestia flexa]